jgi:hypothetical protein
MLIDEHAPHYDREQCLIGKVIDPGSRDGIGDHGLAEPVGRAMPAFRPGRIARIALRARSSW